MSLNFYQGFPTGNSHMVVWGVQRRALTEMTEARALEAHSTNGSL